MGRPSCQSSLLSDPNANFSVEMSRRSNIKEGRHVGLDFYDLLIEGYLLDDLNQRSAGCKSPAGLRSDLIAISSEQVIEVIGMASES